MDYDVNLLELYNFDILPGTKADVATERVNAEIGKDGGRAR